MAAEEITRSWEDQGLEAMIRAGEESNMAFEVLGIQTGQLRPPLPGILSDPVLTSCQREISNM